MICTQVSVHRLFDLLVFDNGKATFVKFREAAAIFFSYNDDDRVQIKFAVFQGRDVYAFKICFLFVFLSAYK